MTTLNRTMHTLRNGLPIRHRNMSSDIVMDDINYGIKYATGTYNYNTSDIFDIPYNNYIVMDDIPYDNYNR